MRGKRLPVPRVLYANDSEAVSKRKLGCGGGAECNTDKED